MSTATSFDLERFARAAEQRDASTQLSMYGPDATVTIADKVSQPGSPRVLHTRDEIKAWLEDMYGENDALGRADRQGRHRRGLHPGVPLPRRDQRAVRDRDRSRRRPHLRPDRRSGLGRAVTATRAIANEPGNTMAAVRRRSIR